MSNLRQAAQQALEAMCCMRDMVAHPDNLAFIDKHISVLQAALAEPEQEPVAYFDPQEKGFYWAKPTVVKAPISVSVEPLPLYSAPTPRKPLTDEEIIEHFEAGVDTGLLSLFADGVRFAERAHGIGEQQ